MQGRRDLNVHVSDCRARVPVSALENDSELRASPLSLLRFISIRHNICQIEIARKVFVELDTHLRTRLL